MWLDIANINEGARFHGTGRYIRFLAYTGCKNSYRDPGLRSFEVWGLRGWASS